MCRGTAYPTILYTLWLHYGDKALLQDHYAGAKKWVEFVRADAAAHGLGKLQSDTTNPPTSTQSPSFISLLTSRRSLCAFALRLQLRLR